MRVDLRITALSFCSPESKTEIASSINLRVCSDFIMDLLIDFPSFMFFPLLELAIIFRHLLEEPHAKVSFRDDMDNFIIEGNEKFMDFAQQKGEKSTE